MRIAVAAFKHCVQGRRRAENAAKIKHAYIAFANIVEVLS